MSAKIPEAVRETGLSRLLEDEGFSEVYQGKVRDTYRLPNYLLVVATDRVSIFDFVLNCLVPQKGAILTGLTVFWLTQILKGIKHHLVAYGKGIDYYLPRIGELRNNAELQARSIIVRRLNMEPVECVVRGYLTGGAWKSYQKDGSVYGYKPGPFLHDGSMLPQPLFTPTTKAESGHDKPLTARDVSQKYGPKLEDLSLKIYEQCAAYTRGKSVIIADTKFEFGRLSKDHPLTLADEVLTPDSSRFWDKTEWQDAAQRGEAPSGYDKEPVRQWGKTIETPWGQGINNLDPENSEHVAFVGNVQVPEEVIVYTTRRYREIFKRLIGMNLEDFQKNMMEIS
ncbi:MAG: phosphoribosylaminoimidazolesuccinocarboxamide synthase [Candidatus Doudnabacteria bacterium]